METFENRDLSYSCEWADVFKYDDIMPSFWTRSSVGTFDSKDTDFFSSIYGGKSLRFRKYPATCRRSNTIRKRYVWTQIFLNMEKKKTVFVFENTRLRVDGAIDNFIPCGVIQSRVSPLQKQQSIKAFQI